MGVDAFVSAVKGEARQLRYSAFDVEEVPHEFVRVTAKGDGIPTMKVVSTHREIRMNSNNAEQMRSLAAHRVWSAYRTANNGVKEGR